MKWFSPSTVTNSTVLPKIFSALNSWMLSPIGTLHSPFRATKQGSIDAMALNSEPCLVNSSAGFSKDNCRQRCQDIWIPLNSPNSLSHCWCRHAKPRLRRCRFQLEVLSHESSVGCTQTAYFFIIDKWMFFAELLWAFRWYRRLCVYPMRWRGCRETLVRNR